MNSLTRMCALSAKEFDCLFSCLFPILHLIVYPDFVQSLEKLDSNNKLLDDRTELLVALTVARYVVDLVIMAKLLVGISNTISRVFVAWMVSLCCVIDEVNLLPNIVPPYKRQQEETRETVSCK